MKLSRAMLLLVGLVVLAGSGCGQEEEPVPTHTLFGKITSTTVDASGHWCYIQVLSSASQSPSVLYSTSCQLSGPGCDYRILFVEEGQYAVQAFIDLNDSVQLESPSPDAGDLAAQARPLILWDKTEMNFDDNFWREVR